MIDDAQAVYTTSPLGEIFTPVITEDMGKEVSPTVELQNKNQHLRACHVVAHAVDGDEIALVSLITDVVHSTSYTDYIPLQGSCGPEQGAFAV